MKIAILGGGLTGLTAAYYLSKKHSVTVFEKESILGGLASGFKRENWEWHLDKFYHHIFANDSDILEFAKEIGFEGFFFKEPETASLVYCNKTDSVSSFPGGLDCHCERNLHVIARSEATKQSRRDCRAPSGLAMTDKYVDSDINYIYRIFPVDSPQDFLKLPYLSLFEKLRAGAVIAFLKLSPHLPVYNRYTAEVFLKKIMGKYVWKKLWEELFRKKFGKYAGIILASFIWSRIKKRTKRLGYVRGGFQEFVNYLEARNRERGVGFEKNISIQQVQKNSKGFIVNSVQFDAVISTLATPITAEVGKGIFPSFYIKQLGSIKYLHALNIIFETKEPILEKTYWLNVCVREFPMMIIAQHTNFIDTKYYGGNNIAYIGNYIELEDRRWKMGDGELFEYYFPYLNKFQILNSKIQTISQLADKFQIKNYFICRSKYAQPIFDKTFLKNKPSFETPVKNFYIANLDMTYPYDRGTNYAVKLGREVAGLF